ncbi:hypothetical protein CY34DRAFT_805281 [Suillus luteus UH-Slu-Lm8-n1]|uniref:Uncharacterized protein n=1 Tax=Suillus luteus UH-Slu-Lm8-n1 TaxID=930992 RepID=A0A0D0BFS5_9AGAM|nr:hypothetical protein CY34DRAFT_805281 [Suillus luteus UH-Slu-Lm8-n1]
MASSAGERRTCSTYDASYSLVLYPHMNSHQTHHCVITLLFMTSHSGDGSSLDPAAFTCTPHLP